MSADDYARALDAACKEYERLHADRAAIDRRLAQITETIGTLTKLCGFVPTVPLGLTDACRMVLRNAGKPMTATEVRDRIAAVGVDLDRYANALSAVHTVLKRMVEGGEAATPPRDETERVAYEFLGSGVVASRVFVPEAKPRGVHAAPGSPHEHRSSPKASAKQAHARPKKRRTLP